MPGVRQTVRGSVVARSAIAALVSSRPPVVMLRRRVLAQPIRLWTVLARPIRLWLCNTPYANMVFSLKSPTHHTASTYIVLYRGAGTGPAGLASARRIIQMFWVFFRCKIILISVYLFKWLNQLQRCLFLRSFILPSPMCSLFASSDRRQRGDT